MLPLNDMFCEYPKIYREEVALWVKKGKEGEMRLRAAEIALQVWKEKGNTLDFSNLGLENPFPICENMVSNILVLSYANNNLRKMEGPFKYFVDLTCLDLSDNPYLESLSEELEQCTGLQELHVSGVLYKSAHTAHSVGLLITEFIFAAKEVKTIVAFNILGKRKAFTVNLAEIVTNTVLLNLKDALSTYYQSLEIWKVKGAATENRGEAVKKIVVKIAEWAQGKEWFGVLSLKGFKLKEAPSFDFEPFFRCVERLDLSVNELKEVNLPLSLSQVRELSLEDNKIEKITGLNQLKCLHTLNLKNNALKAIESFETLSCLSELDLSKNKLTEIVGLEKLRHLTHVKLNDNLLSRMNNLKDCSNIIELNLGNNKLTCIFSFKKLNELRRLNLTGNSIEFVEFPEFLSKPLRVNPRDFVSIEYKL